MERDGWVGRGRQCERGRGSEIGSSSSSRGMAIAHEAEDGATKSRAADHEYTVPALGYSRVPLRGRSSFHCGPLG